MKSSINFTDITFVLHTTPSHVEGNKKVERGGLFNHHEELIPHRYKFEERKYEILYKGESTNKFWKLNTHIDGEPIGLSPENINMNLVLGAVESFIEEKNKENEINK